MKNAKITKDKNNSYGDMAEKNALEVWDSFNGDIGRELFKSLIINSFNAGVVQGIKTTFDKLKD